MSVQRDKRSWEVNILIIDIVMIRRRRVQIQTMCLEKSYLEDVSTIGYHHPFIVGGPFICPLLVNTIISHHHQLRSPKVFEVVDILCIMVR